MTTTDPAAIRLCAAVYRVAMRIVLPRRFRLSHSRDVLDAFRDQCHAARHRAGGLGLAGVFVRNLFRLTIAGFQERFAPSSVVVTSPRRRVPGVVLAAHIAQDVRFAVRSYRRRPGFTIIAVGITALGIGATTTIFSVVDAVVLRPLPYPDPGALVWMDNPSHPPTRFRDFRASTRLVTAWSGAWDRDVDLVGEGQPERLDAALVTEEFFSVFAARPLLGRLFVEADYAGLPSVAVLSHGLWQRRFGADPEVLGRRITLDDRPTVVVGVMHPRFRPPDGVVRPGTDVWLPFDLARDDVDDDGWHILEVVGRLTPGATLETANAELASVVATLADDHPTRYRLRDGTLREATLIPLHTATVRDVDRALMTLFGAVGMLLLIACANVANLFLARGTDRAREMSLRLAIGAGRDRLAGQLLTESVVLALIGGGLGVAIAFAGVRGFQAMDPAEIPRLDAIAVDLRVLLFAIGAAVGTGILFGVAPALQGANRDYGSVLNEGSRSVAGSGARNRLRFGLVVGEVALALVLVTGAGLLLNSFVRLHQVRLGFEARQLVTIPLMLDDDYDQEQKALLADRLVERVSQVPGVTRVTGGVLTPFLYYGDSRCCRAWSGLDTDDGRTMDDVTVFVHPVMPDYFAVLGADVRGRQLGPSDRVLTPVPTVISEVMAERFYGTDEAIGRGFSTSATDFVVVGVVEGFRQWGHDQDAAIEMFIPYHASAGRSTRFNVLVKTDWSLTRLAEPLRAAVWDIEPDLPVPDMFTMRQRISESLQERRFFYGLVGVFALVALLLAGGGVYGVMLYSVSQRQRELGIRVALGADHQSVVRMVLWQGARMAGLGVSLGLVGALALRRVLDAYVFGITTTDVPTLAAVVGVLLGSALIASYVPARRAARADPALTLRGE